MSGLVTPPTSGHVGSRKVAMSLLDSLNHSADTGATTRIPSNVTDEYGLTKRRRNAPVNEYAQALLADMARKAEAKKAKDKIKMEKERAAALEERAKLKATAEDGSHTPVGSKKKKAAPLSGSKRKMDKESKKANPRKKGTPAKKKKSKESDNSSEQEEETTETEDGSSHDNDDDEDFDEDLDLSDDDAASAGNRFRISPRYLTAFLMALEEISCLDSKYVASFHTLIQTHFPLLPAKQAVIIEHAKKLFTEKIIYRMERQLKALGKDGFVHPKFVLPNARKPILAQCQNKKCGKQSYLYTICAECKSKELSLPNFLDWNKVIEHQNKLDQADKEEDDKTKEEKKESTFAPLSSTSSSSSDNDSVKKEDESSVSQTLSRSISDIPGFSVLTLKSESTALSTLPQRSLSVTSNISSDDDKMISLSQASTATPSSQTPLASPASSLPSTPSRKVVRSRKASTAAPEVIRNAMPIAAELMERAKQYPVASAEWMSLVRDAGAIRASEYIRQCCKKAKKTDFSFHGGDIIFLLRNAIFRGKKELSEESRHVVEELLRRWDKSNNTILDEFSEAAHVLGYTECHHAKLEMKWRDDDREFNRLKEKIRRCLTQHAVEDILRFDATSTRGRLPLTQAGYCRKCGEFEKYNLGVCQKAKCKENPLRREPDFESLCEALVWTSVFEECGITPVQTADAVVTCDDVLKLMCKIRPYRSLETLGRGGFLGQCYFITHLTFILTGWGACPMTPRELFLEEYLFLLQNMDVCIRLKDPELVGEFLQGLRILQCPDTHPVMQRGYYYLLTTEKSGKMRGNWVNSSAPFYQRYHAAYCGVIGLGDFQFDSKRQWFDKWKDNFEMIAEREDDE